MEKLTFGQVIDRLKLDEVAIKVKHSGIVLEGYSSSRGFYYDTKDNNILKSLEGNEVALVYNGDEEIEYFVIMKCEEFETQANLNEYYMR